MDNANTTIRLAAGVKCLPKPKQLHHSQATFGIRNQLHRRTVPHFFSLANRQTGGDA
jgi:hypothetical protein